MTHIEFFIDDIPVEQYQQPLDAHAPVATKRQQQPIPATHHVIASNQVCPSASEKRAHQGDRLPTLRRTFSYKRLSLIQQERPRSPSPPSPELATLPSPPSLELGSSDDYGTLVDSDVEAEDALFLDDIPPYVPEQDYTLKSVEVDLEVSEQPVPPQTETSSNIAREFMDFLASEKLKFSKRATEKRTMRRQYHLSTQKLQDNNRPLHQQVLIVNVLSHLKESL